MHYIAVAFVLLSFPGLVAWLNANPRQRVWAYFGLGILPFTVTHWNLDGALVSWATWPGYAKGLILTVEDTLALAIIVTHRKPSGLPPLSGYFIAYLLAALLSVAVSAVPMASAFYAFQLLRVLFVIVAVAKIVRDPRALNWLAMGLAAGICYQAGFAISQKAHGAFQAVGTIGHQNMLGMMTHFVTLPLLAMVLGGSRNRLLMLGIAAALIVITLGASRGAIGFGLVGIALVLMLSLMRRSTPRKWRMIGMAALAVVLISPLMLNAIQARMGQIAKTEAEGSSYDERVAFEKAAKLMWADHPMGVGANRYVVVANTQGYSERAGVAWISTSRSANVHNTYLLIAVETGWAGLFTVIALFAGVAINGMRFVFQDRRDPRGDVVLGCTVAIIVCGVHIFYEWIWVKYELQYLFGISIGIIGGMMRARASEKRRNHRARPIETARQPARVTEDVETIPLPEAGVPA
jgi:O-antigen ligase